MQVDLIGKRFARLTVIASAAKASNRKERRWLCKCDCGNELIVKTNDLTSENTRSCGCLKLEKLRERSLKHGFAFADTGKRINEYWIWQAMIARCYRKRTKGYHNYGGRGIQVCDRWRKSFVAFLEDVGRRPEPHLTIERMNNHGNYEPGNVCWATRQEQSYNTRTNFVIEFRGEKHCLAEWANILELPHTALIQRLRRGWPVERAFTTPPKRVNKC